MSLNRILSQSAFWMVNKSIAKEIGVEGALMLSDLMDKKIYFEERGMLDEDGFFFNTSVEIEKNTTLTYHIQKQCLKAMKERGFVETKLKGLPAKLHFKVVENKVLNFLITGSELTLNPDSKDFEINNNKVNNNKCNNIGGSSVPPSLFPEEEIKPKKPAKKKPVPEEPETIFKNSKANDIDFVKEKLKVQVEQGIDVDYYFNAVSDWSATKSRVYRSERGWIATMTNFMRKDLDNKKLKFVNDLDFINNAQSDDELEYLKSRL